MILAPLYRLIRFAILMLLPPARKPRDWTIDDVKVVLAEKARASSETLNWDSSIVDLCKLLGFNPTFEARRDMYEKADGPGPYTGAGDQNIWLHGRVLECLAQQGFGAD